MPIYILATRLSHEYLCELMKNKELGKKWLTKIKESCPEVKFLSHYFILGPYDFFDIFEAPDETAAAKVSLITQSLGATFAQTWTIMEYSKFKEMLSEI